MENMLINERDTENSFSRIDNNNIWYGKFFEIVHVIMLFLFFLTN